MNQLFWLRSETKPNEFRRALTPNDCKEILKCGHQVIVEDWNDSIIPTREYKEAGCEIVKAHSWQNDAPDKAVIVGLKELPNNITEFKHTHIYFAHVFKGQNEAQSILKKFKDGGGKIIDLEYMIDENKRRVCAFGYWAGYVGAALGAVFTDLTKTQLITKQLQEKERFSDKQELINFVKQYADTNQEAIVIGAKGRVETGASDFLKTIEWKTTCWDMEETKSGGPFREILNNKLFVNCVLSTKKIEPFMTQKILNEENKKLSIISDVTCDPDSECNFLPIYTKATTIQSPLYQVSEDGSLIAFDNFPSMLPKESSYDFSNQLSPFLSEYTESQGPIRAAIDTFSKFI
jgi:alanine dehydrogenase